MDNTPFIATENFIKTSYKFEQMGGSDNIPESIDKEFATNIRLPFVFL